MASHQQQQRPAAIVRGASKGIGVATARALHTAPATMYSRLAAGRPQRRRPASTCLRAPTDDLAVDAVVREVHRPLSAARRNSPITRIRADAANQRQH